METKKLITRSIIVLFNSIWLCSLYPSLCNCSDSKDEPDIPEDKIRKIHFSGLIGEEFTVQLEISTDYKFEIDNPELVTASLGNDGWLKVKSENEGKTTITVLGDRNKVIAIIYMNFTYFAAKELEELTMDLALLPKIIVEATDDNIKKHINEEIYDLILETQGTIFSFDKKTKKFTMDVVNLNKKHEGSYDWNINTLTLNYDNITETFGFAIDPFGKHYILLVDKTTEYKQKYPNAGISNVTYTRVLYNWYAPPHFY